MKGVVGVSVIFDAGRQDLFISSPAEGTLHQLLLNF